MTDKELLTVTSEIGRMLIECGAEIYRAEDSINRIAAAYGREKENGIEVFAIPACLIITIDGADGLPITKQSRITRRQTNLDRVDKLNNLSRYICTEKPDFAKIMTYINQIRNRPTYSFTVITISYVIIGAVFTLFYGGGAKEALTAGVIALIILFTERACERINPSIFFQSLIGSAIASAIAFLVSLTGFTDGFDTVIIGALMTLVPGVTLTNGMRDFIAGDFLAGLYTLTEALLTAIGMAVGTAAAITFLTRVL